MYTIFYIAQHLFSSKKPLALFITCFWDTVQNLIPMMTSLLLYKPFFHSNTCNIIHILKDIITYFNSMMQM